MDNIVSPEGEKPKASNIKKTSLSIKKTASFKSSKKKSKPFITGKKKIKKTTSLKPKPTLPDEVPEFIEDVPEFIEEVPVVQQVESPVYEDVQEETQFAMEPEVPEFEEVPTGYLDEHAEVIAEVADVKASGFFFNAVAEPTLSGDVNSEQISESGEISLLKPDDLHPGDDHDISLVKPGDVQPEQDHDINLVKPVATVVDLEPVPDPTPEPEPTEPHKAKKISMKNQNNEDIRPISIDFSTGPIIKKAVKITQADMTPIRETQEGEVLPPPSVKMATPIGGFAAEMAVEEDSPEEVAPVQTPVDDIISTEVLTPISASGLEEHLQEEVVSLKKECAQLQKEKLVVAAKAQEEYAQLADYLKKDLEILKSENADLKAQSFEVQTLKQKNGHLEEKVIVLESKSQKVDGLTRKVQEVEDELKEVKKDSKDVEVKSKEIEVKSKEIEQNSKEVEEEFIKFIKLADSLLEKLPPEAIKTFLESDECEFYKKVVARHH